MYGKNRGSETSDTHTVFSLVLCILETKLITFVINATCILS